MKIKGSVFFVSVVSHMGYPDMKIGAKEKQTKRDDGMIRQEYNLADRQGWIITLRAIAAMAIVCIHVIDGWVGTPGIDGLTGVRLVVDEVMIQLLVRWAVPCFLMISGVLLLNPQKNLDINKIYRYIIRMVIVLAVFGFGFCLIEGMVENGYKLNISTIFTALQNLIAGRSWAHMWYVYMLIGLYILTPVFRSFVKMANEKEMQFILAVLFLFTIFIPTMSSFFQVEIYRFVPISTYCVFYYLLGYELFRRGLKTSVKWMLLLGGVLGFTGILLLRIGGANVDISGENLFVAIYSAGLFSFCIDNRFLEQLAKNRVMQSLSKCSFGIYILHPLFINILYKGLGVFPDILPAVVGEFLFWLASFGGAYIAALIACRIGVFRKIIM